MIHLEELGWSPFFEGQWKSEDSACLPARVVEEHREAYRVWGEGGLMFAEVAGHLRHEAAERADFPAVGDWVAIDGHSNETRTTIHRILPRRTKFSRKVAGKVATEQIIAANIDTVFLITSLNSELNLRRIERYVATIWESGAQPVILLSKADLCADPIQIEREVASVASGVPIHAISAKTEVGLGEIQQYLRTGVTVALLGSSGVGKSTLINRVLGIDLQTIQEIREDDDRGRHTTVSRKLVLSPHGGILIDTPGMRELQLWDADSGVQQTFEDIEMVAADCRFRDCEHHGEPGCAVSSALDQGKLDPARFESYLKLKKELSHLTRKQDVMARLEEKKRSKNIHKAQKQHYKWKRDS